MEEIDFTKTEQPTPEAPAVSVTEPYVPEKWREETRGDLARGLLWLLAFAIGGVLVFIGLGRLEGTVLAQSIFPSLVALAGTALGFYFGSQASKDSGVASANGAAVMRVPETPRPVPEVAPAINVSVEPATAALKAGEKQNFTAKVSGSENSSVKWTTDGGGEIDGAGTYTAPNAPGTYKVTATSVADDQKSGSATVTVA